MKRLFPIFLLLTICTVVSCKKDEEFIGGKGGAATLRVTAKHHVRPIDSCTVYIRYNATQAPPNGVYDDSAKCVMINGMPVATFSGLRRGNYFLYGYGWDPQLTPPKPVEGGFAYTISQETDQSTDIGVSED